MNQIDGIVAGSLMGSDLSQTTDRGEVLVWPAIIKEELVGPFWRVEDALKINSQSLCDFSCRRYFLSAV